MPCCSPSYSYAFRYTLETMKRRRPLISGLNSDTTPKPMYDPSRLVSPACEKKASISFSFIAGIHRVGLECSLTSKRVLSGHHLLQCWYRYSGGEYSPPFSYRFQAIISLPGRPSGEFGYYTGRYVSWSSETHTTHTHTPRLTVAGVVMRDEIVWRFALDMNVPLVMLLSGGYQVRFIDSLYVSMRCPSERCTEIECRSNCVFHSQLAWEISNLEEALICVKPVWFFFFF